MLNQTIPRLLLGAVVFAGRERMRANSEKDAKKKKIEENRKKKKK